MPHPTPISASNKCRVPAGLSPRKALRGFAPGRLDGRMWVALGWIVMMAGLIWWVTSRNSTGSKPAAEVKLATSPAIVAPAAAGKPWKVGLPGNVALDLVWIAPGMFTMGSPATEVGRNANEGLQTQVTLTKGFWLGKYVVTQAQYTTLMGTNPSYFSSLGKDFPVEQVSWEDAMMFCQKLTAQEQVAGRLPAGYAFTLPTEAQWEYACRAGTTGPYAGNLDAMAWYADNSGHTTHPVGKKQPNAWGLYDMHGNVWEWCADWYGPSYSGGSVTDPLGPTSGGRRVSRGGGWRDAAADCRSAGRSCFGHYYTDGGLGFRVALSSSPLWSCSTEQGERSRITAIQKIDCSQNPTPTKCRSIRT